MEHIYKRMRLRLMPSGDILLAICDTNGTPLEYGNILVITPEGTLRRCFNLSERHGLKVDDRSRIVMDE